MPPHHHPAKAKIQNAQKNDNSSHAETHIDHTSLHYVHPTCPSVSPTGSIPPWSFE